MKKGLITMEDGDDVYFKQGEVFALAIKFSTVRLLSETQTVPLLV